MVKSKNKPLEKSGNIKGKSHEKVRLNNETTFTFAFDKKNYKLLLIGLGFIIIGFLLMIGGGSDDPNVFSDRIFSFRRMTLAPILILIGYVIEIFAIMKKPKE